MLNALQFLDALNENLFKLIVVFFLIFSVGEENTSLIMSITGALFLLPFILFSNVGGVLADRFSKTKIIRITRFLHIFTMLFTLIFLWMESVHLIYFALFFMASVSALFGPSKYGIIPELVKERQILRANGFISGLTFLGIIIGTTLASFLDMVLHQIFWLMISCSLLISITGLILSYFLPITKITNKKKKWSYFIYLEIFYSIRDMCKEPYLFSALMGTSYFLFIGAYVQMNIIPFTVSILDLSPDIGGYLFIFSAFGIALGSLAAPKLTKSLLIVPSSGIGISVGLLLFYLFPEPYWLNMIWLVLLGFFGGLFLVPVQAFILQKSAGKDRGRNFGTANFLSFLFALIASGYLYLINTYFGFDPALSFAITAAVQFVISLLFFYGFAGSRHLRLQ